MNKLFQVVIVSLACLHLPLAWSGEVNATLQWSQRVELTTPVSGKIVQVLVDVGSRANKGDPLLRLDDRGFKAELAKAEARVVEAKDALDEAQKEVERAQELLDRTVLSIHELQLVKIARTRAEARYRGAQAALEQARLNLEYSVIRAPYKAVVLERRAEPAQTVVTRLRTTPLLVVAQADRMIARAAVNQQQLDRLRVGEPVAARVAGSNYDGKVKRLGLEPVNAGREPPLYEVDVEFQVPGDSRLRAGQPAVLTLP